MVPTNKQRKQSNLASAKLTRVVAAIRGAKQVGLVVGQGVFGATTQLRALAEWIQAPVATTLSGRGALPEDHPLSLGVGWQAGGVEFTNKILSQCDLVLAIGLKFAEMGTQSYRLQLPPALIHVDAAAENLGKNHTSFLTIAMDAATFIDALLAHKTDFGPRTNEALAHTIAARDAGCALPLVAANQGITWQLGDQRTDPHTLLQSLRDLLNPEDIVVTDSGYHAILTVQNFPVLAPRTLITPADYQAMGYGIPTAIGVALALPQRKVIALVGDGSLVMSGLELLTAVREELDLGIILLNDGYYGILKQMQEERYGATSGVTLFNPNFRALAASCHVAYQPVKRDLATTLADFVQGRGVRLLDVKVHYTNQDQLGILQRRWKRNVRDWLLSDWGLGMKVGSI